MTVQLPNDRTATAASSTAPHHFSGSMPVQARYQFDVPALTRFMRKSVGEFSGEIEMEQFRGGQSNPTFLVKAGGRRYVLRRKPPGKLLQSAHAVDREYRVLSALAKSTVPVPRTYALCEDESIVGSMFYLMDFVDGRIFWDQSLADHPAAERQAIYEEMNRTIASLHGVDYAAVGLADFGKHSGYFERHIARWGGQYRASAVGPNDAMDRLIAWLPSNIPTGEETTIVHGDFRIDNLIFHPIEPRVIGILDWELSTLGHPLADFAYHCASWHISPELARGLAGLDLEALGIPSEEEYVAAYCRRTGRSGIKDWRFYIAYTFFRLAAISQGVYKRALEGNASNARAMESGQRARSFAELGWRIVNKAGSRSL